MRTMLMRTISSALTSAALRDTRRGWHALKRRAMGRMPQIHYFHQADDPYSHLAAQVLGGLRARYRVAITCHVVPPPDDAAAPERGLLTDWSHRDAAGLARRLDLEWPQPAVQPDADLVAQAQTALVAAGDRFVEQAAGIGAALWRGDRAAVAAFPKADEATVRAHMAEAAAQRARLGHYLGATFYHEGEWYWGVDRLHYLEARLKEAGLAHDPSLPALAPLRDVSLKAQPSDGARPELHFFFSFRSPYTYISVARVRALARHYNAELKLRYILPMVMRGLPVPRMKSLYILHDTKREADRVGLPFGRIVDPRGAATERAIAVLHRAIPLGQGEAFAESFLRGVWSEGVDGASDDGLFRLAARAGLDASFVTAALADESWRPIAEANRQELFSMGLWGAPTLRVNDRPGHWGQDRLWVIEDDLIAATGAGH